MTINFIPNDPRAGAKAPGIRVQPKRPNRPATRAGFTLTGAPAEGTFEPGTPSFLFWQSREAALAAVQAWEGSTGPFTRWQGNRKKLPLLRDAGDDLNAYYDRQSFSFFHQQVGSTTIFSGASTDVVAHEVGHGLLDSVRPELWDAPYLETGAFHEAFGDCTAILTALDDQPTRAKLLAVRRAPRARNFVESTAEDLSAAIRRLIPTHNAAEPRHAFNTLKFQIPETLPDDGGPGILINEVHSFGMIFSGCFYDLVAGLFEARTPRNEANLLAAARTAMRLVVEAVKVAPLVPRFTQAVGRAMVLADQQLNGGENRDRIGAAFQRHGILLGANALLAPAAALAGPAPTGARPQLDPATRRDLLARLGSPPRASLTVAPTTVFGEQMLQVTHQRAVDLGPVDRRLRGVTAIAPEPVLLGASGPRAAVIGHLPEPIATQTEVHAFVRSLLAHDRIAFTLGDGAHSRRQANGKPRGLPTHAIRVVRGKKTLERIGFSC
jgi:hypothetical protein